SSSFGHLEHSARIVSFSYRAGSALVTNTSTISLFFQNVGAGKIRLTALCGEEPECLGELKRFPPFHAGFPANCFIDQRDTGAGTDLWKFSALAQLLEP
ncbi:MAG: hypothetical protein LAT56_15390, partial [Wenzhouxiangella sp.]|nr:hypothetical protein [Wenzhouxiangella sp.]